MKSPSPQTAIGRGGRPLCVTAAPPRRPRARRRAAQDAGPPADAAAAVGADIVEWMTERPEFAVPRQRDVSEACGAVADHMAKNVGHVGRGHLTVSRRLRLQRMLAHEMRLLRLG